MVYLMELSSSALEKECHLAASHPSPSPTYQLNRRCGITLQTARPTVVTLHISSPALAFSAKILTASVAPALTLDILPRILVSFQVCWVVGLVSCSVSCFMFHARVRGKAFDPLWASQSDSPSVEKVESPEEPNLVRRKKWPRGYKT